MQLEREFPENIFIPAARGSETMYSAYKSNHLRASYISLSNSYNNLKTSQLRDTKVRF